MSSSRYTTVAPSAARLTESLRDIGYDFPTAVADIVDNSVAAGARRVEIDVVFDGAESHVSIADDGSGMSPQRLLDALRYGTVRDYGPRDLGRYGLGLKTASLSQCRSVTVLSRGPAARSPVAGQTLDLDTVAEWDDWVVEEPGREAAVLQARETVKGNGGGTVVLWRKLDRVLPDRRPEGGWAKRRLASLAKRTAQHLGIVFHRFLERPADEGLVIIVNGEKVEPWNPFAPDEPKRVVLPAQRFELTAGDSTGSVLLQRHVLPSRDRFSSPAEFERMSGPLNWNRQQGLYIYRADRLVQWGGWNGIRGIDEHTKLARASLDFESELDVAFNINVAKMRVSMPPDLKPRLEPAIHELCIRADEAYRKTPRHDSTPAEEPVQTELPLAALAGTAQSAAGAGLALRAAAMGAGEYDAWQRICDVLRRDQPQVLAMLGLT